MALSRRSFLTIIIFIIAFVVITGYAVFESRLFIKGPEIEIYEPTSGETVTNSLITLRGRALRITYLEVDGKQFLTDENGYFDKRMLLSPGHSTLHILGRDKFDREIKTKITIFNDSEEIVPILPEPIFPILPEPIFPILPEPEEEDGENEGDGEESTPQENEDVI